VHGLVPPDLVFRRNHVSRPVSWRSDRWNRQESLELKNAQRVTVDGNLLEN
jgi:hypothetical protein